MKFPSLLFFSPFLIFFSHGLHAFAPSDLTGSKVALDVTDSTIIAKGLRSYYFNSAKGHLEKNHISGQWFPTSLAWIPLSSQDSKLVIGDTTGEYADVFLSFQSASSGTFTFSYYAIVDGSSIEKADEGSGSFTISNFEESEIPYNYYFNDDFSDFSKSQTLWPLGSVDGLTHNVTVGKFMVTGTLENTGDRWQDINPNTILSFKNDWIIEGSMFTNISSQSSLNYFSAVGFDAEGTNNFSFEFSIGVHLGYVMSEIYVSSFDSFNSQYKSTSREAMKEGKFRVFNLSSNNTLISQYYKDNNWVSLYELNWETGLLTEKNTYSGSDTTHQFSNWQVLESSIVSPEMDYVIPNLNKGIDQFEIISLAEGDLGSTSFSVTEGPPFDMPTSIDGKKLTVNYTLNDGSTGTNEFFFGSRGELWSHYNVGDSSAFWDQETFTWTSSQNSSVASSEIQNDSGRIVSGTLNFTDSSIGSLSLVFYELLNGQKVQNGTAFGTFSISDYSANELPATKGWMWFDEYPWVYSHEEGGWLYFNASSSKLMVYSANDQVWRDMSK